MIIKVSGLIIIRRQVGKGLRGAEARTSLTPPRSGLRKAAVGREQTGQERRGQGSGLPLPGSGRARAGHQEPGHEGTLAGTSLGCGSPAPQCGSPAAPSPACPLITLLLDRFVLPKMFCTEVF